MSYGNPFEARCPLCGKRMGIPVSEWELCDDCAKQRFEPKQDKREETEKDK